MGQAVRMSSCAVPECFKCHHTCLWSLKGPSGKGPSLKGLICPKPSSAYSQTNTNEHKQATPMLLFCAGATRPHGCKALLALHPESGYPPCSRAPAGLIEKTVICHRRNGNFGYTDATAHFNIPCEGQGEISPFGVSSAETARSRNHKILTNICCVPTVCNE